MFRVKPPEKIVLDIQETIVALEHITPGRFYSIIKGLCRAAMYDRWQSIERDEECFEAGDLAFTPRNDWERLFWIWHRGIQKQIFSTNNKCLNKIDVTCQILPSHAKFTKRRRVIAKNNKTHSTVKKTTKGRNL